MYWVSLGVDVRHFETHSESIDYTKADGEVIYGRFGTATFGKRLRGEAMYSQEGMEGLLVVMGKEK